MAVSQEVAAEKYLGKLEVITDELKNIKTKCNKRSLFDYFQNACQQVRECILNETAAKCKKLVVEMKECGTKKGVFVDLALYEKNQSVRKTLKAEQDEIMSQLQEYIMAMERLENDFKIMRSIDENAFVIPSSCGLHTLGNSMIIEHQRMMKKLPIYAWKSRIIEAIKESQFIVLKGETGSGKSTQLPQYFMEDILSGSGDQQIICTQPRKVAAISLAHRIAEEQRDSLGNKIGYWVGMNKKANKKTKLLMMTDRVLLNYCLENPTLDGICCVIIDEAHERSVNTDLLLGMAKEAAKGRTDLKIIVTSATISTKLFSDYFYGCPVIEVPGRIFPVEEIFEAKASEEKPKDYVKRASIKALETHCSPEKGDILVFLTTPVEVDAAVTDFDRMAAKCTTKYVVLPLHGKLQPEDQMKVFEILADDVRKVVFATNVAETSVTIPGIKFVIDSGMVKERFYDAKRGLNYLDVRMISKSSAIQRKGRAGRTGPGIAFY